MCTCHYHFCSMCWCGRYWVIGKQESRRALQPSSQTKLQDKLSAFTGSQLRSCKAWVCPASQALRFHNSGTEEYQSDCREPGFEQHYRTVSACWSMPTSIDQSTEWLGPHYSAVNKTVAINVIKTMADYNCRIAFGQFLLSLPIIKVQTIKSIHSVAPLIKYSV